MEIRVLSVRQPWAWALIHGGKDIENRDWPTKYRGPLAIHASMKIDRAGVGEVAHLTKRVILPDEAFATGIIVGVVDVVDCVEKSRSRWFCGDYGFVCANPRPIAPIKLSGKLGIFTVEIQAACQILLEAFPA